MFFLSFLDEELDFDLQSFYLPIAIQFIILQHFE